MRLSVPGVVPHCHVPLDVVNCEVAERLLMCSVARIDSGVLRLNEERECVCACVHVYEYRKAHLYLHRPSPIVVHYTILQLYEM